MVRLLHAPLCFALVGAAPLSPTTKSVSMEVTTKESDDSQCCVDACKDSRKNKYFSIADDSGPWLCGETCIRDSFFPIFHIFEKNLTKARDLNVCKNAGYTKYKSTVTHGGGGLDCTLDLYECTRDGGCEHPDASAEPILPATPATKTVSLEVTTKESDGGQCCVDACKDSNKNKYFSIADDSGPWLCGETCIRDSFFPIFHIFEKNLTKATDLNVCENAGYTKYKSTVTHGGGGLDCTLDLYECTRDGGCEHPGAVAEPILPAPLSPATKTVSLEVTTKEADGGQCCVDACKDSNKNKYFSIADDSGPWLCGETCIRDSFFPIFHIFEKNLTKATDLNVCENAGYTKYKSTVTHGGGGLDCTLDLYECTREGGCEHPGASAEPILPAPLSPATKTVSLEVTTKESDGGQCCVDACKDSNKNKYFSIADDSGPWLCGETCIRDSFFPIFHIFEKNLTKATDLNVCENAGYTKYKSTVTHGGGGLDCTLDLYECTRAGGCEHPGAITASIFT